MGRFQFGLMPFQLQVERLGVQRQQQIPLAHELVVLDRQFHNVAADLGRDPDKIRGHKGVVGVGHVIGRDPVGHECQHHDEKQGEERFSAHHGSRTIIPRRSPRPSGNRFERRDDCRQQPPRRNCA